MYASLVGMIARSFFEDLVRLHVLPGNLLRLVEQITSLTKDKYIIATFFFIELLLLSLTGKIWRNIQTFIYYMNSKDYMYSGIQICITISINEDYVAGLHNSSHNTS